MSIVVATTLTTFAMDDPDIWGSWLKNAEEMIEYGPEEIKFFAAIEVDARGLQPFGPLLYRLGEIGGEYWAFMLDDGREKIETTTRLRHIVTGQNLCSDYASAPGISHMLFLAADCCPVPDAIPKMLELDHPYVGGHVSTYGLDGPRVMHEEFIQKNLDVRQHMPTAAFMLIRRDVYKRLRWRWDIDTGESDDPAYWRDARELLGVEAVVHHGVRGRHSPEAIGPIESRGHDLKVHRHE